jgi:hypothetical protein
VSARERSLALRRVCELRYARVESSCVRTDERESQLYFVCEGGRARLTAFAESPLCESSSCENWIRTDSVESLRAGFELLDHDDSRVINQVLADTGQVDDRFDAFRAKERSVANTGQFEELRSLNRSCRENDFSSSFLRTEEGQFMEFTGVSNGRTDD